MPTGYFESEEREMTDPTLDSVEKRLCGVVGTENDARSGPTE
jgi:hypothetical protein